MYYWDTYFTNAGLIASGNVEQAKNNADNVRLLINKYGFMPNGNRTHYLGNTQPPFYYKMVEDIFDKTGDKEWLKEGYDFLAEKVAETYIKLLDKSFEKTENLWEKYDGLTGKVANADYNAPKMMGRTAGVYMYSCAEL